MYVLSQILLALMRITRFQPNICYKQTNKLGEKTEIMCHVQITSMDIICRFCMSHTSGKLPSGKLTMDL